jgi:hypothetical protein
MSQPEKRVPVYATIPDSLTDALDDLAVDMKTDPQGVLNMLLESTLLGDAELARRILAVVSRRAKSEVAS